MSAANFDTNDAVSGGDGGVKYEKAADSIETRFPRTGSSYDNVGYAQFTVASGHKESLDGRPDGDAEAGEGDVASTATGVLASDMIYTIESHPPWYLCILLGLQHYLTMFGATVSIPYVLANSFCISDNDNAKAQLLSTIFFVSGITTLLQTTFGCRLPIIQGGTFSFMVPTIALLKQAPWGECPTTSPSGSPSSAEIRNSSLTLPNASSSLFTVAAAAATTSRTDISDYDDHWKMRLREVQGAIMVASLTQVLVGFSGIVGLILRFIGPLTIAPCLALIGLSLFEISASGFAANHWWIALLTMALVITFSQYLNNLEIPCGRGRKLPLFKLFPVILAITVSWLFCAILTSAGALPSTGWGSQARTDLRSSVLQTTDWFRVPYPFQWGWPTVSPAGVLGILAGVITGMIESIGDYYAAARLSGAPPPTIAAINRGIGMEGFGCIIAGMFGSGTGTTSYSENIGALGITKVGSRRVIQYGALVMIFFGMFSKFGALFVTIPSPVVGGMFMVMFGIITAVGLSNLQFVDLNSTRNLFIIGFSLFFGLSLPKWIERNPQAIQTGSVNLDQILNVLLSTSMFVGGAVGFLLDNTISGTLEERGISQWTSKLGSSVDSSKSSCYDLPFGLNRIFKLSPWCLHVPFSPYFTGWGWTTSKKSSSSAAGARTDAAAAGAVTTNNNRNPSRPSQSASGTNLTES